MELHSYAKLRGYKKWTMEQKRKLVETRINYDGIFSRKNANCMDSWKKITTAAKLTDFNVCFVRKQWVNLIARYKAYKRTRSLQLGKNGELNDEVAREISEEWEFFYPIHSFMSRKTTNFHSYAQSPHDDDEDNDHTNGGEDNESDTKTVNVKKPPIPPNTDHDFYSKSASREILDIKMEADEFAPSTTAAASCNNNNNNAAATTSTHQGENFNANRIKEQEQEKVQNIGHSTKKNKKPKPSERDKYYKHKRRYDRRNERRFDALLNVFGQVVKQHFPNVDTTKLNAQSDLVSTEDDDSTTTMCVDESESTCTVPSSDESGL